MSNLVSDLELEIWEVGFVQQAEAHPQAFGRRFGERQQHQIVRTSVATTKQVSRVAISGRSLTLIVVPDDPANGLATVQKLQEWLDNSDPTTAIRSQLLALQGAQIVWHPQCLVVMVSPNRLETVCQAVLEGYFFESQLRSLESTLEANWDGTLADAPLGFEFNATAISRREELAQRFRDVLNLRTRYARLTSFIIVPHVYPPTLASQIGERLRERLRMEERLDLVDGKLEVQEHVYELCSHRASEFMVARTGHHLEWVIIILLGFQTLMWIVDLLSTTSP
ncbi:MAG: hypothetical protein JNK57_09065 [Planctomycetaceae bacterium]|nr:hypothetical protein [Planctomycetaceae bacterium]